MKYQFIAEHAKRFRVCSLCRVLGVSTSGYYDWQGRAKSRRSVDNRRLLKHIREIHAQSRCNYGSDKTWQVLCQRGIACGRHRVARLRREHGIQAQRQRRFRAGYAARNAAPPAPNLLDQDFHAQAPDRIWVVDTTFIATRKGALYLAVVLDLFSRRVVGWSMSGQNNQQLVMDALGMAIDSRVLQPGLIHHSDQGCQYTSGAYQGLLRAHDMIPSMSRKGNCYDNAVVESFFSNLKNELVHNRMFDNPDEARSAIFDYIEVFYNRQRHHQTLNYTTPVQFETLMAVA
ncbi:MAG: IS3 family transposase [Gammaproteobacteria bacterium]|nr:IS3 family transposase [Gammaproteobacteria bacterium]